MAYIDQLIKQLWPTSEATAAMKKPLVFFFLTSTLSANAQAIELPTATFPSATQLQSLEPLPALVKDEYETTEEFEKRKAVTASLNDRSISFYAELEYSYDADSQAYTIKNCFDDTVLRQTKDVRPKPEMDFIEVTSTYIVNTGWCKNVTVPLELSKARAIRNSMKAIGKISVRSQKPNFECITCYLMNVGLTSYPDVQEQILQGPFEETYTYKGEVDEMYLGSPEAGAIWFVNLAEDKRKRQIAFEEAERKLSKFGMSCPPTSAKLFELIDWALENGKSDLVKTLQQCP